MESPTYPLTFIPFGSKCHQSTRAKITHTHKCVLLTAIAFPLEGSHGSKSLLCIKVPGTGANGDVNSHELLWQNNIMYSLNWVQTGSECNINEPNWVAAAYMLSLMVEYFKTEYLPIHPAETNYTLKVHKLRVHDHTSFYRICTVGPVFIEGDLTVIIHSKREPNCYAHGGQWPVLHLSASSGMKCQNELCSFSYYLQNNQINRIVFNSL